MILDIKQTQANFDMEYLVTKPDGERFADCYSPFEKGRFAVDIDYGDAEPHQKMIYNPSDTTYGSRLRDRLSFKIFDDADELVGSIIGDTQKTGFLKAIAYYNINIGGRSYRGYEVGLGEDGLYLCIYDDNDTMIATVKKKMNTVNYKDAYTAYIANGDSTEEYVKAVLPFILYYDITVFADVMERSVATARQTFTNTAQREVREKFDPEFIARVKREDGVRE